ncbi:EamA family transporter [Thalassospira lucentensis]|jgi:O-acetylserine/cysteine efflux transporter|uniref:EamA family transporter n=1 Tax=Thalassospira lucentensis TaxID=168935 RepID=UPI00399D697F|tara:strand:+ start:183 stop:1073 length:891 start_codon:yes stop_codon:yes gene_type:complete
MSFGQFFALLLVVTIWGANFTVIKLGLGEMPPILLSSLRFAFAALPAVFFLPKPKCHWKYVVGFGVVLGCIKFSLLFLGMDLGLSAGISSLVLQLQAFFTVILGFFVLGEKIGPHRIVAMVVAFCGVGVLLLVSDGSITAIGLTLVIAAAAAWGVANIIMKQAGPIKMLSFVVWASLVPPIPLAILSFLTEDRASLALFTDQISWIGVGSVLYLAYPVTLLGFAIWGRLLSTLPVGLVAPFSLLVPIVGMATSALVLGEDFGPIKIVSAILVMTGLLINVFGARLMALFPARNTNF